jgi:hypothetical protein
MSPVEQSKSLITAFLLGDEEATDMLLAECQDPEMVSALTSLAGSFLKSMASSVGVAPEDLWRMTLNCYASRVIDGPAC